MLILHSASGAQDFEFNGLAIEDDELDRLLFNVSQILISRGELESAGLLAGLPFELTSGMNHFGDEFTVLSTSVGLQQYEYLRAGIDNKELVNFFSIIASTINELHQGIFVRFIVAYLDQTQPSDNWHTELVNSIAALTSNQALFTFKDSRKIVHHGLNFRSQSEIKIFDALIKRGLLILPLPVAVMGRHRLYKEPDFVVCYNGKVGILEIHGDKWHPPETAAKEHERRREFARLGVNVYEIFGADRCLAAPDKVVEDFLQAFIRS